MRTANPALQAFTKPQTWSDFQRGRGESAGTRTMSYGGTLTATSILLGIAVSVAVFAYQWLAGGASGGAPLGAVLGSIVGGGILGLVIAMSPRTAPFLSPLYAAVEGVFLGAVSYYIPQRFNVEQGVVFQAVGLCFGVSGALLLAYSAGLVRIGSTATKVILVATGGVALYYLASLVLSLVGVPFLRLHSDTSMIGIGFSLFVVVLASLNLVLDFQFIQAGVVNKAPRYMEWYGAFGLLVTLVWLYVELLRLLAKIQSRD